jgi:N-acyl-D-amino-acid deacylase
MIQQSINRRQLLAGSAAVFVAACAPIRPGDRFDIVIRSGTVFDGTGAAGIETDIGIIGNRIAAVGDLSRAIAARVIDARGLAVSPGFINMLSWATESLIHDGRSMSDIKQGVTLEVFGEGWTMGPQNERMRVEALRQQQDIRYPMPWDGFAGYMDWLVARGISCNVASYVGATTLRMLELGENDVRATPAQRAAMQDQVRAAMRAGALGVGASLIYAPGNFADTEELVALTAAAAESGGGYIAHLRSEADRYLEAVDELITIGRRTGAPVNMYHMKPAGSANWGKSSEALERMDAARAAGIRVGANIYTYTAGATGLYATMPLWVQEGGHDAWVARLRDPAIRARVIGEMRAPAVGWENLLHAAGSADNVLLIGFRQERLRALTGRRLSDVAAQRASSVEDTIIDLIIEDDSRIDAAFFLMSEENIRRNIAWQHTSLGSDAESMAPEGLFLNKNPHPRAYGNFARFLAKYVRDERVIPLADGIRRLTSLAADQCGVRDRGRIAPGLAADIAIFDPAAIQDHATYETPHRYATGMRDVIVNGSVVLDNGEHSNARPGKFVRGPGYRA